MATIAADADSMAAKRRARLLVALRTLAATLGGYVLVYWLGGALAVTLPMRHGEAVYLIGLTQVLLFIPLVIWIFASASVWRVLAIMALVTGASVAIVLLHVTGQ